MGGLNLDEVESGPFASFNGGDVGIFDTLDVVPGHGPGFCIVRGEGDITRTIDCSFGQVDEVEIAGS